MDIAKRKKRIAVSIVTVFAMTITMLMASSVSTFAVSDTGFSFRIEVEIGRASCRERV